MTQMSCKFGEIIKKLPDVTPQPANFSGEYFRRICHVVEPDPPELSAVFSCHSGWPKHTGALAFTKFSYVG